MLRSAPGAAAYAGVGFLAALERALGRTVVADCGDAPGHVLAGLRSGLTRLLFDGHGDVLARLQAIAAQTGAEVTAGLALPTVVLEPEDGAARGLAAALAARAGPAGSSAG
ncbi:MAG: hypothetical protein U1E14_14700 [Geminicoccaceae bacterium]